MERARIPSRCGRIGFCETGGCLVTTDRASVRLCGEGLPEAVRCGADRPRADLGNGASLYCFRGGLAFFADGDAIAVLDGACKCRAENEELTLSGGDELLGIRGKVGLEAAEETLLLRVGEGA